MIDIEAARGGQLSHLVGVLYEALKAHRVDMHQSSSRPCPTCAASLRAVRAYEVATGTPPTLDYACGPSRSQP